MNFDFLKNNNDFKKLYEFCNEAENAIFSAPSLSVVSSRKALESLVKSFYIAKYGSYPPDSDLFGLIEDSKFSSYMDESLLSCIHWVRKIGNNGAHGEDISKRDAISSLQLLYEIVRELLHYMRVIDEIPPFDETIYNNKEILIKQNIDINEEAEPEKKEDLEKYKKDIEISNIMTSAINLTESQTREIFVDKYLKEAGWEVLKNNGEIKAGKACIEIKLEGMPNNEGVGYADYILFDDDLKPLAVIEAKKTLVDPIRGSEQAKLYADCIEKIYGRRPIIYFTNGYITKIIDNLGYPERRVFGFHTKDELHSIFVRRNEFNPITDMKIDKNISDRYFIQNACTSVCEWFNKKHRKALVVMATGTGKTRCAISIVDVLERYGWAKRVLFLADRTALVNQASANFKKYLSSDTISVLSENKEDERDYKARIILSTYQTMINLIDRDDKKLGIGAFDLIILDECHRSIYNKYKGILTYFDSLILGLTATPREQVDKSTYDIFDLNKGEPTFSYEYETAVKEGFLVNFHVFERTTDLIKNGLKRKKLNENEQKEFDDLFEDDGFIPLEIIGEDFKKKILNSNTIDIMIECLMKEGLKIQSGEKLGKTIIFAPNHEFASKIVERFNILYPELGGKGFCKLIDNTVNYAQELINDFSDSSKEPTIAVSVDMLDTGIDVREIVNLVFFKIVKSKIKFWQMIGRGTRTCDDLEIQSPDRDFFEGRTEQMLIKNQNEKQGFYIFDFFDNFEFFRMNPDGKEVPTTLNLSQKIFELKLDMVYELQKEEHQTNEEHKIYYEKYKKECLDNIKKLNRNLINVRNSLQYVEKYSLDYNWNYIGLIEVKEIKKQITPLIESIVDNEESKYFDVLIFNMELQEIIGEKDYTKAIQKVTTICSKLLDKLTIPDIQNKKDFLLKIKENSYWEGITINKLEKVRTEIRDLLKYLDSKDYEIIKSNFNDFLIEKNTGKKIQPQFKNYKERVLDYLSEHSEDIEVIYKIRNLIPLTEEDLFELENILCNELGNRNEFDLISNNKSFAVFVRSIVGIDNAAINKLLSEYQSNYNFNSKQQEFLQQIVNFVRQNGDVDNSDLIYSEPFKNFEYDELFVDRNPLYAFIRKLHNCIQISA